MLVLRICIMLPRYANKPLSVEAMSLDVISNVQTSNSVFIDSVLQHFNVARLVVLPFFPHSIFQYRDKFWTRYTNTLGEIWQPSPTEICRCANFTRISTDINLHSDTRMMRMIDRWEYKTCGSSGISKKKNINTGVGGCKQEGIWMANGIFVYLPYKVYINYLEGCSRPHSSRHAIHFITHSLPRRKGIKYRVYRVERKKLIIPKISNEKYNASQQRVLASYLPAWLRRGRDATLAVLKCTLGGRLETSPSRVGFFGENFPESYLLLRFSATRIKCIKSGDDRVFLSNNNRK